MALKSKQFDDIYFSVEDGAAETRHVFIEGNNLPAEWEDKKDKNIYTIIETGFGTGLNFIMASVLFLKTAPKNMHLHFVSFEKYPLDVVTMRGALTDVLQKARVENGDYLSFMSMMTNQYDAGGFDACIMPRVRLTLIIGDVNDTVGMMDYTADCWFLDGFKPSANPDMWSDTVFQNMARCSRIGTRFATFTAAGFVKRGLQACGFSVQKTRGFGRKRDMLCGQYIGAGDIKNDA